jgi:hypothetical protein
MKHALTVLAALLATATLAHAQTDKAAIEKQLIANEHTIVNSFSKGDAKTFFTLVDKTGVGVDNTGVTKIADLEPVIPRAKVTTTNMDPITVQWIDADTAVLYYKWTGSGTMDGQKVPSPVYSSTIWTKKGGKWMAVYHQESLLTPPLAPAAPKK